MNAREAAKQETRDALIEAALAEFAERGLDAPSLDAICARAGYTRGAFYVHFRDREDLQVAVMERVIGVWLDTIVATAEPAHDLERTVDRFVLAFAEAMAGRDRALAVGTSRFHLVLEACTRSETVRERFVAMIRAGMTRLAAVVRAGQCGGAVRSDVDAEVAAAMLTTLVLGLLCTVQTGIPLDVPAMRGAVLRIMAVPG